MTFSFDRTYLHPDHLGGTNVVTDGSGSEIQRTTYKPFGAMFKTTTPTTTINYTGHRYDDTAGLIFMKARYYDPAMGRFISPDTVVSNSYNPQSLNRFAYCDNNPINFTDPTGNWKLNNFLQTTLQIGSYAAMFVPGLQPYAVMIAVGSSMASAALSGTPGTGILTAGVIGGISAGAGMGVGQEIGNALGEGFISAATAGAGAGFTSGGLGSAIAGGNIWRGAYQGAALGAITAGGVYSIQFMAATMAGGSGGGGAVVPDDPLRFDGRNLTATDGNGNMIGQWTAYSGDGAAMNNPAYQSVSNFGPIPEGNYSVNPSEIQTWMGLSNLQKVAAFFGRGQWPGGPRSWGHERVPIHGTPSRYRYRGNTFIHGGTVPGSRGCIDLTINESSFFSYFRNQSENVPLTVDYSR